MSLIPRVEPRAPGFSNLDFVNWPVFLPRVLLSSLVAAAARIQMPLTQVSPLPHALWLWSKLPV